MAEITLWKPEPDVLIHQALGKAGEEASELAAILFRCTIQGLDESDPGTGKWNRKALFDEIADVLAATEWLRGIVGDGLDQARVDRKLAGFRRWQKMLEEDARQLQHNPQPMAGGAGFEPALPFGSYQSAAFNHSATPVDVSALEAEKADCKQDVSEERAHV
ncbi:hypothetical protein ACD589_12835 [Rhizobium sp. 814_E9_N1_1]|uniref:hypothetical protein n=1 Tax=Rhizobium TaxID=379 RepID=UPI0019822BF4|nr:hypothetical protein [Rhizobium leguminosarum]